MKFESTKNRFNLLLVFFNKFFRIAAGAEKMSSNKLIFFKQTTISFNKKVFAQIFFAIFGTNGDQQAFFSPLTNETNQTAPNFHPQKLFTHFSRQFFSAKFEIV